MPETPPFWEAPFWEVKGLAEMTPEEWESLCDGCALCCLEKLEDAETGAIAYTDVACRLLDIEACRCRSYDQRQRFVADCVVLTADNVAALRWMPGSCAYRRLIEGRALADWHPLLSGDAGAVHRAGISVRDRAVPETMAGELEDHVVDWPGLAAAPGGG